MTKEVVDLVAHPAVPLRIPAGVSASAMADARGIVLSFVVRADPTDLALPERASRPGRRDRLWEHTCCEAFVAVPGAAPYLELNVSPSGDWALWAFDDYRAGMRAAATVAPPELRVVRSADGLRIDAILDAAVLRGFLGAPPYQIGLATIVEERTGSRSFFACRHPAAKPDFHHRDGWTVTVYPASNA